MHTEWFDRHLSEAMAVLVEHAGDVGLDTTRDGTRVTSVGAGPDEFNMALIHAPPSDGIGTLRWARDVLTERGTSFMVTVAEPLATRLDPLLGDLGLEAGDPTPGMARPVTGDIPPPPDDFRIERVTDPAALEENTWTAAVGFGAPDADAMTGLFPASLLDDDRVTFFNGFVSDRDRPVAAAVSVVTAGVAGVYSIAVHEDVRRRGYGAAMTWAAVAAGTRAGVDTVILQATPLGQPVYARMGFDVVRRHRRYRPTG